MSLFDALKRLFGSAANLTAKKAELSSLDAVTFTKIYHGIGKDLASRDRLPDDLQPLRDAIRQKQIAVQASQSSNGNRGSKKGLGAALASYARTATKAASDATTSVQLTAAYVQLGRVALEKYGDKAVPKELMAELNTANDRRGRLLDEIAALETDGGVGFLTVRRVALIALCGLPLLVASLLIILLGYPLVAVYALVRLAVLVSTIVCIYLAGYAVWAYLKGFTRSASPGSEAFAAKPVGRAIVRAGALLILLYLLPVPVPPQSKITVTQPAAQNLTPRSTADSSLAAKAQAEKESRMTADMFVNLLYWAAAMDQMKQQAAPPLPQRFSPSYTPPSGGVGQSTVPYGGGANQTATQRQQWQATCTKCGRQTLKQSFRGGPNERCKQYSTSMGTGGSPYCGGVLVWQPVSGN